jgi:hypothetical protein
MVSTTISPSVADSPPQARRAEVFGWLTLAALLVLLLPPYICMPLTVDTAFYDICARYVLRGGALERDLLYLPPPGMTWALAAVRATLGGSSVAARAADLGVVAAIIALLAGWLRAAGQSRAACVWLAVMLAAFYLTTTEWEQVQPDTWMFLPALGALELRRRQVAALTAGSRPTRRAGWALVEGLLWGAGCLVKPFVVVPGLATWLASAALVRRTGPGWARQLVPDAAGVLVGGLLMGTLWQVWLLSHASWGEYWHNFREFRGDYYSNFPGYADRVLLLFVRLPPWGLLHLAAVPVAVAALLRTLVGRGPLSRVLAGEAILAAFYLGWLLQANFIQSQFYYQLVPCVFLAAALLAGWIGRRGWPIWGRAALAGFWIVAVVYQPAVRPARLTLWADCWRRGPTPEMMDRLHLKDTTPTWVDLERVADYLRRQGAGDRDVLCFDLSTTELQTDLGIRPPTRHIYVSSNITTFAKHREAIRKELQEGPERWVVIDLVAIDVTPQPGVEEPPASLDLPPGLAERWPYSGKLVFRAGRYCVFLSSPASGGLEGGGPGG